MTVKRECRLFTLLFAVACSGCTGQIPARAEKETGDHGSVSDPSRSAGEGSHPTLRGMPGVDPREGGVNSSSPDQGAAEEGTGIDAGTSIPAPDDAGIAQPTIPGGPDESLPSEPGPMPFIHPLFTDHMVLQRDALTPVWGWTTVGEEVTVTFAGHRFKTTADAYGRWLVRVGPFSADAGPLTLDVTGSQHITLHDVQVGDVWLCSGQSNMVKILKEVLDGPAEVAASKNSNIRFFKVQKANSKTPRQTLIQDPARPSVWQVAEPRTTENFSAVCFFMARELHKQLQVPIGLITTAWGSTGIQSWMSAQRLSSLQDFFHDLEEVRANELRPTQPEVTTLYNAMLAPLQPFGLKGVAWYQGEYNGSNGSQYTRLLPMFMDEVRSGFRMGQLPFLIVQLPSYIAGSSWPSLREAQLLSRRADARTGMAVTIDVGNPEDVVDSIHPLNKQDVGQRLAMAALGVAYGRNLVHEGPLYRDFTVEGQAIRLHFDSVGSGLMVGLKRFDSLDAVKELPSGTLQGFEIAGADSNEWVSATATIDQDTQTIVVSAPSIREPRAVRYGWGATPSCNLYNRELLPASPFRTHRGYRLHVVDGNATPSANAPGEFIAGTRIKLTALPAPIGTRFQRWVGDVQYVDDPDHADTMLTMPEQYTSLRAVYGP